METLLCVAVCCSVLQCVAVCCSLLQCVAVCCSALQHHFHGDLTLKSSVSTKKFGNPKSCLSHDQGKPFFGIDNAKSTYVGHTLCSNPVQVPFTHAFLKTKIACGTGTRLLCIFVFQKASKISGLLISKKLQIKSYYICSISCGTFFFSQKKLHS